MEKKKIIISIDRSTNKSLAFSYQTKKVISEYIKLQSEYYLLLSD
jgi:hypothetical protein